MGVPSFKALFAMATLLIAGHGKSVLPFNLVGSYGGVNQASGSDIITSSSSSSASIAQSKASSITFIESGSTGTVSDSSAFSNYGAGIYGAGITGIGDAGKSGSEAVPGPEQVIEVGEKIVEGAAEILKKGVDTAKTLETTQLELAKNIVGGTIGEMVGVMGGAGGLGGMAGQGASNCNTGLGGSGAEAVSTAQSSVISSAQAIGTSGVASGLGDKKGLF